jgi:DNA invertase Pin-like site-specific DNA recombinase/protein tyrosine phosphatase (PTP) superfamily phosphohydrolase (DUF442 family)
MVCGYARVSTGSQSVSAQVAALRRNGAEKVFREMAQGDKTDRAQLRRLLDQLANGDVPMVTRLDRLARSTRAPLSILAAVTGKKAGFRSLADTWADTTTPHDRLMLTVLGGLAEFEKDLIRARTAEGREREGARREARAQAEADRASQARGDSPARHRRRAGARDRPQLQRQPQHDFAAHDEAIPATICGLRAAGRRGQGVAYRGTGGAGSMIARQEGWDGAAAGGRVKRAGRRGWVGRTLKAAALSLGLMAAPLGAYSGFLIYDGNFHAVVPGVLYRSAELSKAGFEAAARQYGLKSVLNLRGAHPGEAWYDAEIAAARETGMVHYDYPISAKRILTPSQIAEILDIVRRAPKPLLIHCMSGADRSGLVAALYEYAIAGRSAAAADGQLSLIYGHFPYLISRTGAMDRSFWAFVHRHSREPAAAK